ncbi:MAG: hypothetical protein ACYTF9_13615 [Planctomycetota bacterium]|jgi:hypothetical protein
MLTEPTRSIDLQPRECVVVNARPGAIPTSRPGASGNGGSPTPAMRRLVNPKNHTLVDAYASNVSRPLTHSIDDGRHQIHSTSKDRNSCRG